MTVAAWSLDPTARDLWRRGRAGLAIVAAVVLLGTILAVLQTRTSGGPLDPKSARQDGGRALAVLLAQQGVEVVRARTLADAVTEVGDGTTLLVTRPDLLVRSQLDHLARTPTRHLVLFTPGEEALAALAPGAIPAGDAFPRVREPGCDLRPANRAGTVRAAGPMFRALTTTSAGTSDGTSDSRTRATTCYGDGTRGALVRLTGIPTRAAGDSPASTRTVDVVGTSKSFTNASLADEGHAALALNLLGDQRRLVWYVPSLSDVQQGTPGAQGPQDPFSLLPDGLRFGIVQIAVAVALLMLVSARRLGPVVPEPLPVVVRASEAVEGRARLYHRARARDRAATALREATRSRIAPLLGLPPGAAIPTVVAAVAARTGRAAVEVERMLDSSPAGSGPADDHTLVGLADDLDTLEQEVRRS